MAYYILKVLISAALIVGITEISKKSSLAAGIFASIPLVSVMALIWLYIDTQDLQKISGLSTSIFWLVIPSLSFFIMLPVLLKTRLGFYPSLIGALLIMVLCYFVMIYLLEKFGIHL